MFAVIRREYLSGYDTYSLQINFDNKILIDIFGAKSVMFTMFSSEL